MKALILILLLTACRAALRVEERYVYVPYDELNPPTHSVGDRSQRPSADDASFAEQEPSDAVSQAATVTRGRILGNPRDPRDFRRAGCDCSCAETMESCRCLHCLSEPGAECYCDQGEPKCLCGLDMGGCRCAHCAGRDGVGVCPCDHSKTREELERRRRAGSR
jgi:hypothetical protein